MKTCPACGRVPPPQPHQGNPRKWCSESCRQWAIRRPGEQRPSDWWRDHRKISQRPCEQCGVVFQPKFRAGRFCSPSCLGQHNSARYAAARLAKRCAESDCDEPIKRGSSRCGRHTRLRWPENPEKAKARHRARTHRRKTVGRHSDVTPEYEQVLRAKAKRCPLCKVRMVKEPYLPASKELDHIVPLNVGGTHTIGNVRIICRTCNITRPHDGSDYAGPVTLWAEQPGFVVVVAQPKGRKPALCQCGTPKVEGRCWTCDPSHARGRRDIHGNPLTVEQAQERGRTAARMRADGVKWQDIADELGFGGAGSAYLAVQKYGDPEVVARHAKRRPPWWTRRGDAA
jgi:catechol 2,3-dioxygenase-like lactoylglutathione lyase family enzyme